MSHVTRRGLIKLTTPTANLNRRYNKIQNLWRYQASTFLHELDIAGWRIICPRHGGGWYPYIFGQQCSKGSVCNRNKLN